MDSKSLMIGDWVQIVSDAPIMTNEYHRIDWIRTGEVGLDNRKIVTYPYIRPISLTAEILEKNFPDPEIVCWYPDNNTYRIGIGDDVALNIKYVHELQHALRLCGIKKEIEL